MADRIIKLALWNNRTFTPIMNHEELEPIMASLGFALGPVIKIPSNVVADDGSDSISRDALWKEYSYSSSSPYTRSSDPPRPKLPYPVIDGLHICTYQAFWDSINFYLRLDDELSQIFHIRGMTLNRVNDRSAKWSCMEERDDNKINIYVYREGLYDISSYNSWKDNRKDVKNHSNKNKGQNPNIRHKGNNILAGCKFVPMKDVVVQRLTSSQSKKCRGEQNASQD